MNVFTFTGRIGNNAEVRYTANNAAICSFSVATEAGYGKNKTTTWIRCALWGKRAEGDLPTYLLKGAQVCVSGELSAREWEKEGVTKTSVEVNVRELTLIGAKPVAAATAPENAADFDDDIPF